MIFNKNLLKQIDLSLNLNKNHINFNNFFFIEAYN